MEAIKCPNCGSEKVQGLTEEKFVCLACDNVFLIHNLSKEFQQTDEHISSMHQDLKEDINKLMEGSVVNESAMLEKAEEHLKKENWSLAYELYAQLAEEFPQHSAGWIGKYKALTGNFSQVERYARFVCDGNYIDLEDGEDRVIFEGYTDIKCALNCDDADRDLIKKEVTQFIKKCAEYGKSDIENSIKDVIELFEQTRHERDLNKIAAKNEKLKDQIKDLIPAFIMSGLFALCVMYFFASGDWLGKVLGIAGCFLVLKFGGRKIVNSIRMARAEEAEWEEALASVAMPLVDEMDNQVTALLCYCSDLDNYNKILQDVQNEDLFIQNYINNPLEGLIFYSKNAVDEERFLFDFLDGKIERYRYLLPNAVSMQSVSTQSVPNGSTNLPKMMYCSACGTKISADSAFCFKCGQKLQ